MHAIWMLMMGFQQGSITIYISYSSKSLKAAQLPLMMTVTNRGSIHNVDRREIYHYLPLNTAGRARLLDMTLTMRQFVNMISEFSNNESVSLELLRMVPHSWAY